MVLKALSQSAASILVIVLTSGSCLANSEDNSPKDNIGFFTQGSVADMSIPMDETEAPEIQYGTTKGLKLPQKPVQKEISPNDSSEQAKNESQTQDEVIPPGEDPQAYKLKQEFGDPNEVVPVKGVDTAPKPYKAMLKAIDMGRDDLALVYANQLADYMKNLNRITGKATAMVGVAKLDPSIAEGKVSTAALSNIDPQALSTFLEKRKLEKENQQDAASIEISDENRSAINAVFGDSDSQQALKSAEDSQISDPYERLVDPSLDPVSRKLLIRTTLAGKLPIEPSGNVQVLFFLHPSEQASIELGKQVSQALASPTLGVTLSVVPLSVDGVELKANSRFFEKTGIPALLRDGSALSRKLKINQFPALLFVTDNSEQAFLKTGKADAIFVEEVARMIGGK